MRLEWTFEKRAVLLQEITDHSADFLHAAEQARLQTLTSPSRREEFIASRWLARRQLCATFGGIPNDWTISAEFGQAPRVTGPAAAHLSISHSGDWIAVAVSDTPVGLDIERIQPRKNVLALAKTVATAAESQALATLQEPARSAQFIQRWTLKEAWLKCRGSGLDFGLMRRLSCVSVEQGAFANAITWLADQNTLAIAIVVELESAFPHPKTPTAQGLNPTGCWMLTLENPLQSQ